MFHNTSLQAPPAGSSYPLGAGSSLAGPGNGQMLKDTVSRNSIFHIWKSHWNAIYNVETGNDLDYDMTNGGDSGLLRRRAEPRDRHADLRSGPRLASEAGGNYQLAPNSPGFDKGARIPNFNDSFNGAAPDMGAHEAGKPSMQLGVSGTGFTGGGGSDSTGGGTGSSRRRVLDHRLRVAIKGEHVPSKQIGFTLLELLVVIVIIGLLAGYVAALLLAGREVRNPGSAGADLPSKALDQYRLEHRRYPTAEEGLVAVQPYLKKTLPNDPWGRAVRLPRARPRRGIRRLLLRARRQGGRYRRGRRRRRRGIECR